MATVRVKAGHNYAIRGTDEVIVSVLENQPFDSDHPLVRAHPEWFRADTPSDHVEEATANPGRLRNR